MVPAALGRGLRKLQPEQESFRLGSGVVSNTFSGYLSRRFGRW
jgi:hypothetical protein